MIDEELSAEEKRKGRSNYQLFQIVNAISFTLISGSLLTLYALRLGATSVLVGLISSMTYLSVIATLIGRVTISRIGTLRQFGLAWLIRSILMLPVILAPVAAASHRYTLSMLLIILPFLLFNVVRGIGVVSMNPTLGRVSVGKDRGEFLSRSQSIVQIALIASNLLIALYLGADADTGRYVALIIFGISAGILASILIFRLPDPGTPTREESRRLFAEFRNILRIREFRRFLVLTFFRAGVVGMAVPFLVVYAKEVYLVADNVVIFFLVVGNVGAIAMGFFLRRLIDRLGAKPLFLLFSVILAVSVVPIIVSPALSGYTVYPFLGALFFVFNFGLIGGMSTGQNYFFAIASSDRQLNLGILQHVFGGFAGASGAFLAGSLLGWFDSLFPDGRTSFQLLYAIVLLLVVLTLPLILRLKDTGRFSVRDALMIVLSRKDLKAVALLQKLDTTRTQDEEARAIDSLAKLDSTVPVEDLLAKLESPRFYIRSRALRALDSLPPDSRITEALLREVQLRPYTTGHAAARILGRRKSSEAAPNLIRALDSPDYRLQGESALALARIGDRTSIARIETLVVESENPLVKIYAAAALQIMRSVESIPALIHTFNQSNPPDFLRDEIILSIAGVLGIDDWFYPMFAEFLENDRHGVAALLAAHRDCESDNQSVAEVATVVGLLLRDRLDFGSSIAAIFDRSDAESAASFADAARDADLLRFDRLAFLFAAVAVRLSCDSQLDPKHVL